MRPVPCIGVVLTGTVQLVKEDIWGNKAILAITYSGDLFGETFVCSNTSSTSISFWAACDTEVLFLPFERVLAYLRHGVCFSSSSHRKYDDYGGTKKYAVDGKN